MVSRQDAVTLFFAVVAFSTWRCEQYRTQENQHRLLPLAPVLFLELTVVWVLLWCIALPVARSSDVGWSPQSRRWWFEHTGRDHWMLHGVVAVCVVAMGCASWFGIIYCLPGLASREALVLTVQVVLCWAAVWAGAHLWRLPEEGNAIPQAPQIAASRAYPDVQACAWQLAVAVRGWCVSGVLGAAIWLHAGLGLELLGTSRADGGVGWALLR